MKIHSGSQTITITHAFEYAEIVPAHGKKQYVYRVTTSSDGVETSKQEGIVSGSGLRKLKKTGIPPMTEPYCLLDDETFADLNQRGYLALIDTDRDRRRAIREDIFDYIVEGGDLDKIVRIKTYDHTVWRLDGTIYPTAILFDYISANMNNRAYDIDRAFQILSERSDVTFLDNNHRPTAGKILRIPYYNSECGETYLSFAWRPSQEQRERLYECELGKFKLIFDEDMLGLRAGGAALFDCFYKSKERVADDDDW